MNFKAQPQLRLPTDHEPKSAAVLKQFAENTVADIRAVHSTALRTVTTVPPHPAAPGVKGDFISDGGHGYVCVENNQWVRFPVGGW